MVSVYGLGNPLMDIILRADHEVLRRFGAVPGSMNLVEYSRQEEVISCVSERGYSPGGSCANTIRGLAWLAGSGGGEVGSPAYAGAIGLDENGDRFESILRDFGVVTRLARKEVPTGSSAIVVTPDFERTMFTFLGACREFEVADFDTALLSETRIFHTTGYMWDTPNEEKAAKHAILEARQRGIPITFDIADPFVAHRYRKQLLDWLPGKIDVLFANLEELRAMTMSRGNPEEVIRAAASYAPIVVMKIGRDGCLISGPDGLVGVPGEQVTPRDTTGAGDSFAAGFLYARLSGRPLEICGRLANRIASRVVTVQGCDFQSLSREDVLAIVSE
jgi:sugar/nucleoside kinase (ribokinase family)